MNVVGYNSSAVIRSFCDELVRLGLGSYQNNGSFRNGHTILYPLRRGSPRLYVVYKRDFFVTFQKQFSSFCSENPQYAGVGESINAEAVDRAARRGCDFIVFIHPGEVLCAYPLFIKKFCLAHGLVRGQKRLNLYLQKDNSGSYRSESEVTYSFPKKLLKRFEEEQLQVTL